MLSLEEPLGPPGVGLAPGGGAPQPPCKPIRRETLARSVCQGLLLRSYTPRLGGRPVVSPAIHILKPMKWMPGSPIQSSGAPREGNHRDAPLGPSRGPRGIPA